MTPDELRRYKREAERGCRLANPEKYRARDPLSPSIDHIIPLDKGGLHEPKNVQLAHLRCNLRKGTKVEQGEEVNSA